MQNIINAKAIDSWKISIEYKDGLSGEINLSHLKNDSEYESLHDPEYFSTLKIDDESGDLVWDNGISLCKNAIYRQLELKRLAKSLKLDLDKVE